MIDSQYISRAACLIVDNALKTHIPYEYGELVMGATQPAVTTKTRISESIDWTDCTAVVQTPGIVSGQWRVRGTRIPLSGLIEVYNAGHSPEDMATNVFVGLPVDLAREVVRYAAERS
jgi:uncharacterized protein (DUF433 family)